MSTVTVNDSAAGVWAARSGEELELVGPGANHLHVLVRRRGERRAFGMPRAWVTDVKPACPCTSKDCHECGYEDWPDETVACGPRIADGGLVTKEGDDG